jgi:hypothetical protein
MATGKVEIRGPITKEEDNHVSTLALKNSMEAKIAEVEKELVDRPNSKAKKKRLETLRLVLAKIEADLENHPGGGRFRGIELPPRS